MNANECNAQWEYSYSIHKEGAHVANAALARRGQDSVAQGLARRPVIRCAPPMCAFLASMCAFLASPPLAS